MLFLPMLMCRVQDLLARISGAQICEVRGTLRRCSFGIHLLTLPRNYQVSRRVNGIFRNWSRMTLAVCCDHGCEYAGLHCGQAVDTHLQTADQG
jgi:hypothetical protein